MPNIKSAKKRVKVIEAKTRKNKMAKSRLKTELKKVYSEIEENKSAEALSRGYKAVSYTHLDVYKRQRIRSATTLLSS